MELNERQIENIARAYRHTLYIPELGDASHWDSEKEKSWQACRENWMRDTRVFIARLKTFGLEIAPIQTGERKVVDEKGTGRHG